MNYQSYVRYSKAQMAAKDRRIAAMQEAVDHMVTENACLREAPHIERDRLNAGWKAANEAKLEAHQENDRLLRKIMEQEKQIIFMKTYIDFVHKTT